MSAHHQSRHAYFTIGFSLQQADLFFILQSSLSSLWGALTAPFKRASSRTDANADSSSYSGTDVSESEEEPKKITRRIREPYVPNPGALRLSKRGEEVDLTRRSCVEPSDSRT